MKKATLIILFLVALSGFYTKSQAQVIKVGGGMELRSEPPIALITKATYRLDFLHENLRSSIDLMVLPDFEANLDFHYSFLSDFGINGYAIGGLNFASNLGGNVGAGIMVNLSERLDAFGEVKYIIKSSPEASIKLGILYNL